MRFLQAVAASLCIISLLAFPAVSFADTSYSTFLTQLEQEYKLPSGILWKVAMAESGGKATAGDPAHAYGLFQWLPNSWAAASKALYGSPLNPSFRTDPTESAKVTAFALGDANYKLGSLIGQTNINLTVGLYLSHFLGINGAQHFLNDYIQNPGQSACALFPKECQYNPGVMSGRSLSQVVNYFAGRLQTTGVPNIAGNFQDSSGTSYAYSSADLNSSCFSSNTQIGNDPELDYQQTFTPVANSNPISSPAPILANAPQTALPASYTTPPAAAAALAAATSTAIGTIASSSAICSAQYYCQYNTVYYESDSCSTTVFQSCQYGCSGNSCAASPNASSSSFSLGGTQPLSSNTSSGSGSFGTALNSFFATSTLVGTATSLTSSSSMFSTVEEGVAVNISTGATSSDEMDEASGTGQFQSQGSFGSNAYQNVYIPAPSPIGRILNDVQAVLGDVLSYLHSL